MRTYHARLLTSVALAAMLATATSGCMTTATRGPDTTGVIVSQASRTPEQWRREVELLAPRYRANPRDIATAISYAQALRASGQRQQAAAVLEQTSIQNPQNRAVLSAYGRALADNGNYEQALDVLGRAHTPEQPDWHMLSVQGAVLDQLGRHPDAQRYYASALKIVPEEPSVLSNLGLSYALSKDLVKAEETLRRAAQRGGKDPRVRQNLALVIGLQGRFQEAEEIARGDLSPDEASANVAYLRQMLTEQTEKKVARTEVPKAAAKATARSRPKPGGAVPGERVARVPEQ
jgi:Flp pilus assembly protein TadD